MGLPGFPSFPPELPVYKKIIYKKNSLQDLFGLNVFFSRPGMLLQEIVSHVQRICLSQDEPYAQFVIYYVQDSKSEIS